MFGFKHEEVKLFKMRQTSTGNEYILREEHVQHALANGYEQLASLNAARLQISGKAYYVPLLDVWEGKKSK